MGSWIALAEQAKKREGKVGGLTQEKYIKYLWTLHNEIHFDIILMY